MLEFMDGARLKLHTLVSWIGGNDLKAIVTDAKDKGLEVLLLH